MIGGDQHFVQCTVLRIMRNAGHHQSCNNESNSTVMSNRYQLPTVSQSHLSTDTIQSPHTKCARTYLLGQDLLRGVLQDGSDVRADETSGAAQALLEARHVDGALAVLWLQQQRHHTAALSNQSVLYLCIIICVLVRHRSTLKHQRVTPNIRSFVKNKWVHERVCV